MATELDYVPIPDNVVKLIVEEWRARVKDGAGHRIWN